MPHRSSHLTPEFSFDPISRRYRNKATGRFVSQQSVRTALDFVVDGARGQIDELSMRLVRGQISLADWQLQMARQIKTLHLASASAARGGWAQMSQGDYGFTGSVIRREYGFLNNFANEVASGEQRLNGNLLRRARMYGEAARSTHDDMRRRMNRDAGLIEERRVLGQADHCPDCVDFAAEGWQPIGTLPRIGDSLCKTHCHCHFEFRDAEGNVSR
jgi:hypothetical protein